MAFRFVTFGVQGFYRLLQVTVPGFRFDAERIEDFLAGDGGILDLGRASLPFYHFHVIE